MDMCQDEENGTFIVYLTWKNGKKTQHPKEVVYRRCPQKVGPWTRPGSRLGASAGLTLCLTDASVLRAPHSYFPRRWLASCHRNHDPIVDCASRSTSAVYDRAGGIAKGAEGCPVIAWSSDFSIWILISRVRACVFSIRRREEERVPVYITGGKASAAAPNIDRLACLGNTVSQPIHPTGRGPRSGWPTLFTYVSVRQSQMALLTGVPEVWNEEMNFSCSVAPLLPSEPAPNFGWVFMVELSTSRMAKSRDHEHAGAGSHHPDLGAWPWSLSTSFPRPWRRYTL